MEVGPSWRWATSSSMLSWSRVMATMRVRVDPGAHLHLLVEEQRRLGARLRCWEGHRRRELPRELEPELPRLVLEDRPQLHELGDERAQVSRRRVPDHRPARGRALRVARRPRPHRDPRRRRCSGPPTATRSTPEPRALAAHAASGP